MKWIFALIAILVIAATASGEFYPGRGQDSDTYLGELFGEDKFYGHPFTHDEYLKKRGWPVKAGICFVCDDGDTSFYTAFVHLSDSIYAADGVRIKGTTFVMASNVGVLDLILSVDQLRSLNQRQDEFEVGCHGPSTERVGPSQAHSSYSYLDSLISSYQDSAQAWGISCFRSYGYANWRMQLGMGEIWKKNGIYQCKSVRIVTLDSIPDYEYVGSTNWDWPSNMQVNCDPWPSATANLPENAAYQGYHRIGVLENDYDVGSRTYSSKTSDSPSGTPDSLKKFIDLAIQTGRIGVVTLHNFGIPTGDSLAMPVDSLAALMGHVSSRMREGVLDSYTFEQACARMRGYPVGNLLPHYGFRLLNDGVASLWDQADTIPIGWPYNINLYHQVGENWTKGTSTYWSVFDLSAKDTVLLAFTAEGKADSVTYGESDTSKNIAIIKATSLLVPSQSIPFYVWTSGTECKYVNITVQACVSRDTCSTLYCAFKCAEFEEVAEDYVNGGRQAYEVMIDEIGGRNAGPSATSQSRRSRMRMLSSFAFIDTTQSIANWPTTGTYASVVGGLYMTAPQIIRPYVMDQKTVNSWYGQTAFANYYNLTAASNAWNSLPPEWPVYYDTLEWKSWNFKVPVVHGRSDCLCGHIMFRNNPYNANIPSTNLTIMVSNIAAYTVQ